MKNLARLSFVVVCIAAIVPALAQQTPATRPAVTQPAATKPALVDQAKVVIAKADLSSIRVALEMYQLDSGEFPGTDDGLKALLEKPSGDHKDWHGPYMEKLPKDPWGKNYIYRCPGTGGKEFDLLSGGPDGREGGGDDIQ